MAGGQIRRGVGRFGDEGIEFHSELSSDDFETFSHAIGRISRISVDHPMRLVEANASELEDLHLYCGVLLSVDRSFAQPDQRHVMESVARGVVNVLTSVYMFTEHSKATTSREFGKESRQVQDLRVALSRAFDEFAGYRFLCKLRAYVQHVGYPMPRLSKRLVEESLPHRRVEVGIQLSRDDLLRRYDEWGAIVGPDLQAMPEYFDLMPLIRDGLAGVRQIRRAMLTMQIEDAARATEYVESYFAEAADEHALAAGAALIVGHYGLDGRPTDFQITAIPIEGLDVLRQVRIGEITPESIITDGSDAAGGDDVVDSPLDPDTVANILNQRGRGFQILSSYLVHGGGSPEFVDTVGLIALEDGSLGESLAGLVEVAAVFLHMAARAIGADPKAMLGGMSAAFEEVRFE